MLEGFCARTSASSSDTVAVLQVRANLKGKFAFWQNEIEATSGKSVVEDVLHQEATTPQHLLSAAKEAGTSGLRSSKANHLWSSDLT